MNPHSGQTSRSSGSSPVLALVKIKGTNGRNKKKINVLRYSASTTEIIMLNIRPTAAFRSLGSMYGRFVF